MLKLALVFVVICFVLMAEARKLHARRHQDTELHGREFLKKHLHRRSCIPVGATGCAKNDGNCCRKGNPFTGVKRKCVNKGSFFNPEYTCLEP